VDLIHPPECRSTASQYYEVLAAAAPERKIEAFSVYLDSSCFVSCLWMVPFARMPVLIPFNMYICSLFFLLLLAFLAVDQAYGAPSFDPQCAIPPSSVNIVSSPNVWGTSEHAMEFSIRAHRLYRTIHHLNIPE